MTLLVGRQEGHPACRKLEWWGAGVVIGLQRGADLHGPADATATHCVCIIFIIVLFFQSHLPEANHGRCTEFQMYIAAAVGV